MKTSESESKKKSTLYEKARRYPRWITANKQYYINFHSLFDDGNITNHPDCFAIV